jgi:hypothetical protein
MFRDMNQVTERNVLGPRLAKAKARTSKESQLNTLTQITKQKSVIPLQVVPDIEHQSICYFVDNFVILGGAGRPGYLDFIPELYAKSSSAPYFKDALTAVSLASLATHQELQYLLPKARKIFGRAMSGMRTAMENPKTAKSDHLLASSFLFSKYEARF